MSRSRTGLRQNWWHRRSPEWSRLIEPVANIKTIFAASIFVCRRYGSDLLRQKSASLRTVRGEINKAAPGA